jgi:hypothetical protein
LRKMVLLRWSVGAVGAGGVPGGAIGGARFGVLRLGEGRVPSRDYVGRVKVPVAGERGAGVGRRLVGRRCLCLSPGYDGAHMVHPLAWPTQPLEFPASPQRAGLWSP